MAYLGAKSASGTPQAIINVIPPHDCYIEPFLGTGAIMQRKAPAQFNYGVDLNNDCIDNFPSCNLPNLKLINGDAFSFLENFDYAKHGRVVVYCDPPYPKETRTSKNRYKFEFSGDDHLRLLKLAKALPCFVIVSSYESELYAEQLADWWSFRFQAMTRGGVRTEVVWCNFNPGDIHFHTFAGTNYTDRQRIQRKAERMAKKFQAMPPMERQAVLALVLASLNE
uniref:site-specific DNA-methyltransferase (adenine-specific) n=1 Tax=Vibrio sp. FF_291 TaxID=1652832 RepID=A0A0H3ZMU7_9VIBR|nr:Methyltransferase [Vibrio sp. FF_291]